MRDVLPSGASVWLKSDFTWRWEGRVIPAISFGQKAFADTAAARMEPGDLVISVRVTNTKNSEGKPGLMEGLLQIVPGDRRTTDAYLSREILDAVASKHGRYWPFAIGASRVWQILGEPDAADVAPRSRLGLSRFSTERGVARVVPDERDAVLDLEVVEVTADVDPSVAAMLSADKRRRTLASRAAADLFAVRLAAGLIEVTPRELERHGKTGRIQEIQDAAAALEAQADRCALCGGKFGSGRLAPVVILGAGGAVDMVHAACRALERHAPGDTYEEGARTAALKDVALSQPERNSKVPLVAIGDNLRRNGRLVCEICEEDWLGHKGVVPDNVGRLFEVHHRVGVAKGEQKIDPLKDVVVVCALCHKLAHSKG